MWRSHLKKRIGKIGGIWWFVTLTAHENLREAKCSLKNIRDNIEALMKRLHRIYGTFEYVRVYEKHVKGAYHAHFILNNLSERLTRRVNANKTVSFRDDYVKGYKGSWALRTWFKKTARSLGMGYMVDVQRLDEIRRTVNYICKYMTKSAQMFEEKGLRRIQTSRGIGSPKPERLKKWNVCQHIWATDLKGRNLYDANLKLTVLPMYFRENYVYPSDK